MKFVFTIFAFKLCNNAMNRFRYFVENQVFGVCARVGEVLNISASSIRLYFIYATFLTFGSPIIIYLVMAFWMEIGKHLRRHKSPTIWEW
jgi:phage shock protein PspC (stress-responsive transcriptional regulator)